MLNLLNIIKKNFIILWRSKISATAVILTPLLIVLLASFAFSTSSLEGINMGVVGNNSDTTSTTNSILNSIENESIHIEYLNSSQECKKSIKEGNNHICMKFPTKSASEKIIVYADESRMDIAYYLINIVEAKISSKSSEIGATRASKLLNETQNTKEILIKEKKRITGIIDDLKSIKNDGGDLSSSLSSVESDISSKVSELEDVKESLDDIETNDSIEDIKSDIDSAMYSFPSDSIDNIDEINSEIEKTIEELEDVRNEIDKSVDSLDKYKGTKPRELSSPLNTEINSLTPNTTNWRYLFPTFMALIILFCGIILGSVIVMREKRSSAYFRNFITSTSDLTFFLGIYLTGLILLFIEIGIVLGALALFIEMPLISIIYSSLAIIFISGTIFILLGMFIGYLFNSEETIVLTSVSIAALLIFFSDIILPIEAISGIFKNLAKYNPLIITISLLRKITLFKFSITNLFNEINILLISVAILFILSFSLKVLTKRNAGM